MNNDLTFFTNEPERNLYDRFGKILNKNTQFFDVLVGYFRASGFYLLQEALENASNQIQRKKYLWRSKYACRWSSRILWKSH